MTVYSSYPFWESRANPDEWEWVFEAEAQKILKSMEEHEAMRRLVDIQRELYIIERNFKNPVVEWMTLSETQIKYFLQEKCRFCKDGDYRSNPDQCLPDLLTLIDILISCGHEYVRLQDLEDARTGRKKTSGVAYPRDAIGLF
jgi:hypothetical protein